MLEAKPTIYDMATALSVYFLPQSLYYQDPSLWESLCLAMDFVERIQRRDGSFDFPSCNFFSAADTAFCFKRLLLGYDLLERFGQKEHKTLQERYRQVMRRALLSIRDGGFHTPNHRWAIAAALLRGSRLFKEEAAFSESLKQQAHLYLAEGIDQDADGQYSERSTGNYNAVVNAALLSIHRLLPRENYLFYVENNLRMMLTFMEPDGTVFTADSTRQDQNLKRYGDNYFYQYLYAARECGKQEDRVLFGHAAHAILRNCLLGGRRAPDCLPMILVWQLEGVSLESAALPLSYRKYFSNSGLLRVGRGDFTYTILRGKSPFLFLRYKSLPICFRLGISYCEKRSFEADTLAISEDTASLVQRMEGWYYLPFSSEKFSSSAPSPESTPERKGGEGAPAKEMLLFGREKLINSHLDIRVSVKDTENGLSLTLHTRGLDRLPLRLEISVPSGCGISHRAFALTAEADSFLFFKEGHLELSNTDCRLRIGPGFHEHAFTGHYSGEEHLPGSYTLFLTAYTPLDTTLHMDLLS